MVSDQSGTGIVRLDCDNDDDTDDAQCGVVVFPADDILCPLCCLRLRRIPQRFSVTQESRATTDTAANTRWPGWQKTSRLFANRCIISLTTTTNTPPPHASLSFTPRIITQRRPFAQGVSILECTQTSGDIIYVPSMCVRVTCDLMRDVRRVIGDVWNVFVVYSPCCRWGHSVLYLSNTIGVAKLFTY